MLRATLSVATAIGVVFIVVALALTLPPVNPLGEPAGRMSAADARAVAISQLESMATQRGSNAPAIRVLSTQLLDATNANDAEPDIGLPDNFRGRVWIVRAEGPFVAQFGPPHLRPIVGDSGYFVIDDSTGEVISMGMP